MVDIKNCNMNYTNKGTDGKTKIPNKPFTYVEIKTLSKWQPPPSLIKRDKWS